MYCKLCGSKISKEILKFTNMPVSAQDMPSSEELDSDKGIDFNLVECDYCGLVQLDCEPVSYYRDVIRAVKFSPFMVESRKKTFEDFIEKYNLKGKKVIEIGCGTGELVDLLSKLSVKAFGIENSDENIDCAATIGANVWKDYVDSNDKVLDNAPFDAFVSFNYLEHQPNPLTWVRGIWNNLTDDGVGLVTVPSLEYILKENRSYEFIRDHIVYYSFDSIEKLFLLGGFDVLDKQLINNDSIQIVVQKRKRNDFSGVKGNIEDLSESVNNIISLEESVYVWGASHQSFTILSTTKLGEKTKAIIDSAPFKQGRFSPGTHIPIISPDKAKELEINAIVIIAPTYSDEISNIIKTEFDKNIKTFVLKNYTFEEV